MIDLSKLANAKRVEVTYFYPDVIDKQFIKDFRIEHNLTQNALAHILGVSKKAVEKWEQGVNNIRPSVRNLLWLLQRNSNLIEQMYSVKIVERDSEDTLFTQVYSYKEVVEVQGKVEPISIKESQIKVLELQKSFA